MASGCAASAGVSTRASDCGPPTRCWRRSTSRVRRAGQVRTLGHRRDDRKRSVETWDELTAQGALFARLASAGLSNADIGTRLCIGPGTIRYHLRKVFTKLDVSARHELACAGKRFDRRPSTVAAPATALATGGCEHGPRERHSPEIPVAPVYVSADSDPRWGLI